MLLYVILCFNNYFLLSGRPVNTSPDSGFIDLFRSDGTSLRRKEALVREYNNIQSNPLLLLHHFHLNIENRLQSKTIMDSYF